MTGHIINLKMNTKKNKNVFAQKWGEFVIKNKWSVFILSLILAIGLGYNAKIEFDGDYHAFFNESNPELDAFDALQEKYTKDDNVIIVLSPKNGNVFTKENLTAIEELTSEAWNTPYSSRVDALTNFQHTRAEGDDLYVDDLSYESSNKTVSEIASIKEIALKEPLLVNRIIDEKGSLTAINITVKLPGVDSAKEIPEVTGFTRNMISDFQKSHPNFDVHTSGMVPLNTAFFEASMKDMALTGIMLVIVIIVTLLLTRSVFSTIATLIVILFSIMSAAGFVGIMGIKLTPPSAVFPTMILTLAVADSIHVLITMLQNMRDKGMAKNEALLDSIKLNFMPIFITSLTTIIGFLTMNFGDVPPFWDLGNITAFGITAAFIFSLTTLPALISILPIKAKKKVLLELEQKELKPKLLVRFGNFVAERPVKLATISVVIIAVMAFLATKNTFNDEFINYFDESVPFRTDTDYISQNLTGIYNVEFSVGAGESGGINNPEYLEQLSNFETWLKLQPEVIHVNAFSEVARRINRSMHGDDETYYRIPDNRESAAQYLLLYEMSLPFGLDLNNQMNVDKSESRVTVTIKNVNSADMIAFSKRAEDWLKANTPEHMHAIGVSPTLMFSTLGFRQADSMLSGNIIALLLISIVLIFALKDFKLGLLSIIPNVAPVLVGFGVWALYKGQINTGMVVVFGMTLGIIVDDTVHFMSKFLRARRDYQYSAKEAVVYAFSTVGTALIVTTVVLLAGFTVLSQSSFALNSYMARITVIILLSALIIDFVLLPSLLILVSKDKKTNIAVKKAA